MAGLNSAILGHEGVWHQLERQRQAGHLPHALGFVGSAGIGKRKMAWAVAQALLCESPALSPCGECGSCRRVATGQSESVLMIEPQADVIKIDSARSVLEFFQLRQLSRARIVIIDDAQTLNPQAANTLLKIVEEPPPQAFLILVVSEVSQLLPTLRSRLQMIRFAPLNPTLMRQLHGEVEEWRMLASRGSLQRLEEFSRVEGSELRQKVCDFLRRGLAGEGGFDEFMDLTKDRETLPVFIHFTQELLRDWLVPEQDRLHADLSPALSSWPPRSSQAKAQIWRRAYQMETDMAAHVDRGLILQNFFSQLRYELS